MGMSEYEAALAEETFYHHDRHTVRELARQWEPGKPVMDNKDYVIRAQELEKELEMALFSALDTRSKDDAA
jgi:CPA2 family monovalent cation:H+ antiporter-2